MAGVASALDAVVEYVTRFVVLSEHQAAAIALWVFHTHAFEAAELLRSLTSRGHGVVLTIHDLALAAGIADRVVVLHRGRIVADGTPEAALTPSTLREVYGIEAQWLSVRERGSPLIAIHGRHVG